MSITAIIAINAFFIGVNIGVTIMALCKISSDNTKDSE